MFVAGLAWVGSRGGRDVDNAHDHVAVPGPSWRVLDSLHLRLVDEEQEEAVFWVQFDEVAGEPGTFGLVNPKTGHAGGSAAPGRPSRLSAKVATLHLATSTVDGPPGSQVTLTLDVSFKPHAAKRNGHRYAVEVLAIDDAARMRASRRPAR